MLSRIAADVERAVARRLERGQRGGTARTTLARGDGWVVEDVICTSGPDDPSFEEHHAGVSIAVVVAGTFQYRAGIAPELLTPGSLLLGNDGRCYECGHQHATGDRCVAFRFAPAYFERIAFDASEPGGSYAFRVGRLPPLRELSWVSARAAIGLLGAADTAWDEFTVELAVTVLRLANGAPGRASLIPRGAESRVTASVRSIERDPMAPRTLQELAREARLSTFHYLRTFTRVTGVTPHQFILRTRLREAAARLATKRDKVAEVALGVGFDDLSNFNHSFRVAFGMSPREFRRLYSENAGPRQRSTASWVGNDAR